MIILYTTCKNQKEAQKIAEIVLQEKLIACANILPSTSLYFWHEKLQKQTEAILILKTAKEKVAAVEKRIKQLHSYKLPCILHIQGTANDAFETWVVENNTLSFAFLLINEKKYRQ